MNQLDGSNLVFMCVDQNVDDAFSLIFGLLNGLFLSSV